MRSANAVWVEPKEWQLLETLAPHLKRAAEIHQLLARERTAKESLGAGIAAAGFAAFLLSKDYRMVFANAKAEELLRAALFVIDPAANFGAKIERFAKLHGLTAAETKCVAELVRGKGLPAAAARLKIGHSTARSHCQNIFFKTATTRQGELIRRFFETAI